MRPSRNILICLLCLAGFFYEAQSGISTLDSIYHGGVQRKYRTYIPKSYDGTKSYPLLINLHGLGSDADQQQLYSNFTLIADTAAFLIVHPEGTSSGGTKFWNPGLLATPDDVGFINALIDSLNLIYMLNKDAVYSCGLSNGGVFSYYLSCTLPNKFAAIASVGGTMFRAWFENCKPQVALPVMVIHGTEDGTVPYMGTNSGGTAGMYLPIDSIVQKWVKHNHCNPTSIVTDLPDINASDLSTVKHYAYKGGADGSAVELYKVVGGSHSWPGAVPVIYKTNQDFNASVEIWRFFRQYRLSQFVTRVSINIETEVQQKITVFPNPSTGKMFIEGIQNFSYSLHNMDGRILTVSEYNDHIDLQNYAPGMYVVRIKTDQQQFFLKIIRN